jgi:hypothetical protein
MKLPILLFGDEFHIIYEEILHNQTNKQWRSGKENVFSFEDQWRSIQINGE